MVLVRLTSHFWWWVIRLGTPSCPHPPRINLACSATTHSDILLRARARDISTEVIHNASIMNAIGACGLQLYNFGQAVSLVFFTETWKPDSFYDRIAENWRLGMHTLLLLDIKVKEQSEENLARHVTPQGYEVLTDERFSEAERSTSHLGTCRFRWPSLSFQK